MLFALLPGAWFACLGNLNEAGVLGSNRPDLNALANLTRMLVIAAGLPLGYWLAGFPGAIAAIVAGEAMRYATLAVLQVRLGVSFLRQDILGTLTFLVVAAAWSWSRAWMGDDPPWIGLMAG